MLWYDVYYSIMFAIRLRSAFVDRTIGRRGAHVIVWVGVVHKRRCKKFGGAVAQLEAEASLVANSAKPPSGSINIQLAIMRTNVEMIDDVGPRVLPADRVLRAIETGVSDQWSVHITRTCQLA